MSKLILPRMCGQPKDRIIRQGLVAEWNFDEKEGQYLHDYSGNGNHGLLGGTTDVNSNDPTPTGSYYNFLTDDYIDCGNDKSIDLTGKFYIELVFKAQGTSAWVLAKNISASTDVQYGLFWNSVNRVDLYVNGAVKSNSGAGTVPSGTFCHVGLLYDKTKILYLVNNIPVATVAYSEDITPVASTLLIGKRKTAANLNGSIAKMNIYNGIALSQGERTHNYNIIKKEMNKRGVMLP